MKNEKDQDEQVSWLEVGMYLVGGLAGAALGILTAIWMGSAIASNSPFFWFVSRAAGIVAYLLLWLATAWGITMSSKGLGGRVSGPLAYTMHNITSWLAIGFSLAHGIALLGDASYTFTLPAILVPFASAFQPALVGLGTLSLYLGIVVTGAFYMKKRLGLRAWRRVHALSYLMFAAVTVHSVALGTDTSTVVMKVLYLVAGVSVALLTMFRAATAKASRRRKAIVAAGM